MLAPNIVSIAVCISPRCFLASESAIGMSLVRYSWTISEAAASSRHSILIFSSSLAAAGRRVQQHPLGRRELVLLVVVRVQVGQLHSVLDRLDLRAQPADLLVADVRHFL